MKGRLERLVDFIDDRTGVKGLLGHLLDEPIRGGARWVYVFGSALLGAFAVQTVTGIALMTSYAPSDKTAWASVHFITFKQAGGWLLRGLHHFGAQAMVIVLAAHVLQVALYGAYKKPREVTWWFGLALLAVTLGFALTGYLLPWDQKGYWATRVATNIAGTIPFVGDATQRILQGGSEYGSQTLTRFYALHVVVLPALLALLVGVHVALVRKHGITPSARANMRIVDRFFPKQVAKDLGASIAVVAVVFYFAMREHGAPLDAPADPSSDYPARPEWYFLALFQLLKYFHGPFELVGTVVVPGLLGAYLFLLPLLERRPTTALRSRVVPLAPFFAMGAGLVFLTAIAMRQDAHDATFQKERVKADARAKAAVRIAMDGVPPDGPLAMMKRDPSVRGPELFDKHCAGCHTLGDDHGVEKDRTATALSGWSTEAWILEMIHDPDGDTRFGRTAYKGEMPSVDVAPADMPTFKPMPDDEKRAVAAFLASLGDEPGEPMPADALRRDAARVEKGKDIVTSRCTTCHLYEGKGDDSDEGLAPELSKYASFAWVRAQIANPATKATYREHALDADRKGHMPKFEGEMRPEDIDVLARWVRTKARSL